MSVTEERIYKTTTKSNLAVAYGFRSESTIVKKIRERISRLSEDDDRLYRLGIWTGNCNLLPDQTEILVELLGKPQEPELLYSVQKL